MQLGKSCKSYKRLIPQTLYRGLVVIVKTLSVAMEYWGWLLIWQNFIAIATWHLIFQCGSQHILGMRWLHIQFFQNTGYSLTCILLLKQIKITFSSFKITAFSKQRKNWFKNQPWFSLALTKFSHMTIQMVEEHLTIP